MLQYLQKVCPRSDQFKIIILYKYDMTILSQIRYFSSNFFLLLNNPMPKLSISSLNVISLELYHVGSFHQSEIRGDFLFAFLACMIKMKLYVGMYEF